MHVAKKTVEAMEETESLLKDSSLLTKLHGDVNKLCSFKPSDTKTFAVLGDSGQGKSSLINSLLQFPGIAKTGDIGSACTSVVTEYRQKSDSDTPAITIEVEYLSASDIKELISELLWSYRQFYLPGVESDETLAEDYDKCVRESEQAWSALEAAFGHQEGFNEEALQDMSEGTFERLKNQLFEWSRDLKWPKGSVGGVWKTTADDADECCEKTDVFMSDRYWPFTKIIRIYLDSPVLKTGVVLADLPGLQDTNLARVRATQDYLVRCSNILIVANISRAVTDQSLKSALFSVIRHHVPLEWDESAAKSLKIAVVCTKVDEINETRARKEFCGPDKRISPSAMDKLDIELRRAKLCQDSTKVKELKQRCKLLLIEARNEYVKTGIQQAYAAKVPERKLDVFCVSNKWYEKYGQQGNVALVSASGIPRLRGFCQTSTADKQLQEARHFLETSLAGTFNSFEMWTSCSIPAEAVQNIQNKLSRATNQFDGIVRVFEESFKAFFEKNVIQVAEQKHPSWVKAAEEEYQGWLLWHYSQFTAWCRNNGNHRTRKRPREDWNAKIINKMRMQLAGPWEVVESQVHPVFHQLSESMQACLLALKKILIDNAPPTIHNLLSSAIEFRLKDSQHLSSRMRDMFAVEIRNSRLKALESNSISYIFNEMISTYRSAAAIRGVGSTAVQKNLVRERLADPTLFPTICRKMSSLMEKVLKETSQQLEKEFGEVLGRIRTDLDLTLSVKDLDPCKLMEREKLLKKINALKMEADALARYSAAS